MKIALLFSLLLLLVQALDGLFIDDNELPTTNRRPPPVAQQGCNLSPQMVQEIQSYAPIANKIVKFITSGKFKGKTWAKLAEFVDKFGSRIAGSKNLENAIDYMLAELKNDGLDNVHGEDALVPHWVRSGK